MKTARTTGRTRINVTTALQRVAAGTGQSHRRVSSHDEVERRICRIDARGAGYHKIEARCSEMLAIAGTGILIYSASLFHHPICRVGFPTPDSLHELTASGPSPANGIFSP
ncbi:MAG: hypothetical protein JO015_07765 [Verrucomicrobia bacterium]|nr:hypothetical protein [Verrucomicrobiota bacterium]